MLGVGLGQSNSDSALNMKPLSAKTDESGWCRGSSDGDVTRLRRRVCVPWGFQKVTIELSRRSDLVGRLVMESWGNNVTAGTDWVFESAAVQLFWY